MTTRQRIVAVFGSALLAALLATPLGAAFAQDANRDFSLQVSPSPIVTSIKPGETQQIELRIRNNGGSAETLKIEPRSFTVDSATGRVVLKDTKPDDISDWLRLDPPTFEVTPGQWYTERFTISLPESAGFSYSFALVVSRVSEPKSAPGTRQLKGSVAVFTLINVDRPDARRKIDVAKFISAQRMYEYLPAELSVEVRNSGNTIVQPYGNIFIQRSSDSTEPIDTIPVNEAKSYILPGTTRTITTTWKDGFPAYVQKKSADNAEPKNSLSWNWSDVSKLRMGRYTAKLVAVYNNGQRDVPIQAELQFWVIPWRIIAVASVIVLILVVGLWSSLAKMVRVTKRNITRSKKASRTDNDEDI